MKNKEDKKLIIILGPTASGKSSLAVKLLRNLTAKLSQPIRDRSIRAWILEREK